MQRRGQEKDVHLYRLVATGSMKKERAQKHINIFFECEVYGESYLKQDKYDHKLVGSVILGRWTIEQAVRNTDRQTDRKTVRQTDE